MAGIFEQGIGGVFFEAQGVILDDAAVKVGVDEGEEEDGSEQCPGFCAAQFFDAVLVFKREPLWKSSENVATRLAISPASCSLRKKSVVLL